LWIVIVLTAWASLWQIVKMGIVLGDGDSYFECKISAVKGVLTAVPKVKEVNSTLRAACKRLIEAVGLNSLD
jgi:hypothetical protein